MGRIQHFGSTEALDIEGLGEKTSALLVKRGLVEQLPDLLDPEAKDIEALEGFAEKSAHQVVENVRKSRKVELHRFLYGLGIPEVGQTVARTWPGTFGPSRPSALPTEEAPPEEKPLGGVKFVFTGALERFTRDEARELVESLGGRATSSVSSKTDYVVVGEDPGQTANDAAELDVETLDENGFLELVRDAGGDA